MKVLALNNRVQGTRRDIDLVSQEILALENGKDAILAAATQRTSEHGQVHGPITYYAVIPCVILASLSRASCRLVLSSILSLHAISDQHVQRLQVFTFSRRS